MVLRRGDSGAEVEELQKMLNYIQNAGLVVDGDFGRNTERAVKAFQAANGLLIDGVYGMQTETVMLAQYIKTYPSLTASEEEYRKKLMDAIKLMVDKPVIYGPGRGMFKDDRWIILYGPGGLGMKKWGALKTPGPSFHCTSLVNFMLSYLFNRNKNYTHAGNCLQVMTLIENDNSPHMVDPTGKLSPEKYRGFGGRAIRLASDGDTVERNPFLAFDKMHKYLDGKEIIERQDELGLLTVWSQSTKSNGRWNWDHHTGFIIKAQDGTLNRFASDGYVSRGKYSCSPIAYGPFTFNANSLYQVFKISFINPPEFDIVYPVDFEK
jgi:hypothetical protein